MGLRSKERDELSTQLARARERIAELEAELKRAGSRDALAHELLSLRTFRAQIEVDLTRASRFGKPFSLAVLDLDGFRAINAHHGHAQGDAVLAAVGSLITAQTRGHDLACRTAGDEFAIALPDTSAEHAVPAIERILRALEEAVIGRSEGLSASVGVAEAQAGQSFEQLAGVAGTALDQARAAGGGRMAIYSSDAVVVEEPAHDDVVAALSSALEERDRYTGEHSESVVDVTGRVAEGLGLADEEVARIRTAALLHDIGKIGIPDAILNKPGPLGDREWEIMHQHPAIGERIVRAIPGMGAIARIIRHEHERWDGAGYPDRLAGKDIPIGSRIILACDAYHAMVSDRPYREAVPHSEAMAELTSNAGTQFDPQVIEVLVGYIYGRRQAGLKAV